MTEKLPRLVKIKKLNNSRYDDLWNQGIVACGKKPEKWDLRVTGNDVVETDDSEMLILKSDGGQSPPQEGWVILLTSGSNESGFKWTLYGLP